MRRQTQGEHLVKINAEIGVMRLQVKVHQKLLPNSQQPGEQHRTSSLLELLGGTEHTDTLISGFRPRTVRSYILLLEPSSLWDFVTAAP